MPNNRNPVTRVSSAVLAALACSEPRVMHTLLSLQRHDTRRFQRRCLVLADVVFYSTHRFNHGKLMSVPDPALLVIAVVMTHCTGR